MSDIATALITLGTTALAYGTIQAFWPFGELPKLKIQPDPIPRSMHWLNVRSAVPEQDWIRIKQVMKGNHKIKTPTCECCGATGRLECHEVWEFVWPRTQKLTRLKLLCHLCHMVHHVGFAIHRGEGEATIAHFMKVNGIDRRTAERYIKQSYAKAKKLNNFSPITMSRQHRLDLTFLNQKQFCFMKTFTTDERKSCNPKIKI